MRFDWDTAKAAANRRKHDVSFEEAKTAFEPGSPAIFDDLAHSQSEMRYIAIGFSDRGRMLSIAFTYRGGELVRIINARKATRKERELYAKCKEGEAQGEP